MSRLKRVTSVAGCLFVAIWVSTVRAQPPTASAVDMNAIGPQVGATVPDFDLTDHTGHRQSLQTLMGPKGLVLVFFRSADW
jgi:cytochrome oxidase Cu insertion factor (SCO1/SenC/PrrC family)